ncbi:uncharacterized protein LOC110449486 isoform X2 [Mizuhopecten yessoensis]|nr:uncharacterized protein LOC110449486 isoform X2 [Mizuhopecten yessoensis]
MESSWFAFETILTLERSQQRGKLNCVILLHGVREDQLPQFALFQMIDKYELHLDELGNWKSEQVQEVIQTIQVGKLITCELPVGNVAHAQAWSHYFGYHHVIHPHLAGRIRQSKWYEEKNKNMPIVVYELIPKSCDIPRAIHARNMKEVGQLEPILVDIGGNVKRPYRLNVYCIQDGGEKYYCVAQYPSVLGAIRKMELSHAVDMDAHHKMLQVARFYYTLHAIIQHSKDNGCRNQTRLLFFDDSVEDATDVLLKAIKKDVQSAPFDTPAKDIEKIHITLEEDGMKKKEFDAAILYNSDDQASCLKSRDLETYLGDRNVSLFPNQSGTSEFEVTFEKVRWLILIITKAGISNNPVFKMQTMSMLSECVNSGKVRIIPVIDSISEGGNIPDLLKWVTYIDMQTQGYEERVYQALKGENIPMALNANHIPAGNLGYGLAWGYVVNYLKIILPLLGAHLQMVLRSKERNICVCPDKLYLLVPKTCKCPGKIDANHVEHVYSFTSIKDVQGGANIIKSLDIYSIEDDDHIQPKVHYFVGQYPSPLRCLSEMNTCNVAGINSASMVEESKRFCDTLNSLLSGTVGEGLHNKCELVVYDDTDPDALRSQLLPKIHYDVGLEKSQRIRKSRLGGGGALKQPKMTKRQLRARMTAMEVDDITSDEGHVFISYSSEDYELVITIKEALKKKGILSFVASTSIAAGTPLIDGIVHGINTSRKGLFLVTQSALKSSWFAFETILALERSQQLGKIGAVILFHGVPEDQLPKMAMFDMIPRFTLSIDSDGDWTAEQVQRVVEKIHEVKSIDCELPVGNIAHAQAWSHFFGFHNIVHAQLEQRIKESQWYQENPANMPIKMYELVPSSCIIPFVINDPDVKKVGTLAPIVVNRAGNKTRPYMLNVYSIEDDGKKYYCIAQYPNVLSAIQKMEVSPFIQMDPIHRELQLSRFYYTLNAILHHSDITPCHNQSRLLYFDDNNERPRDILLKAIQKDVENAPFEAMARALRLPESTQSEYDVVILYSNATEEDMDRKEEIESFLRDKHIRVFQDVCKKTETSPFQKVEEAVEKCRWIILIITRNCIKDAIMNMKIMALLGESISKNRLRIIPVIDDLSEGYIPEMLRWVTYIDMQTNGYKEQIYRALKGEDIPLALDAAHIPAGNLGYGLAWGYLVNYLKTVLPQFGPYLQKVLDLQGATVTTCPEKLFLLVPISCKCTGLISDRWTYVDHFSSFVRLTDNLGGANIIKSLDIYSITENDSAEAKKRYFIGQYPAPVLCLWEMNDSRLAGINEDAMRREQQRFCDTISSLLRGPAGEELHTKCELVLFDDSDPEDLRRKLIPRL